MIKQIAIEQRKIIDSIMNIITNRKLTNIEFGIRNSQLIIKLNIVLYKIEERLK